MLLQMRTSDKPYHNQGELVMLRLRSRDNAGHIQARADKERINRVIIDGKIKLTELINHDSSQKENKEPTVLAIPLFPTRQTALMISPRLTMKRR